MERISIFHHKLARAHDAKTRANFIAEFGLDLIKINRELFVGTDFFTRNIGNYFLMRRAKTEIALMPVLDFQHLWAKNFPTPSFVPELFRLHCWHQQFQCASLVHLITHNRFHFAQHTQAQRHPAIKTRAQALDQPSA